MFGFLQIRELSGTEILPALQCAAHICVTVGSLQHMLLHARSSWSCIVIACAGDACEARREL
jgi:hypothetical protein